MGRAAIGTRSHRPACRCRRCRRCASGPGSIGHLEVDVKSLVVPLAGWCEPIDLLPLFAADPMPALLYSATDPGADLNRWSILCAAPYDTVRWSVGDPGDPFRLLAQAAEQPDRSSGASGASNAAGAPAVEIPFHGGAVGYNGYGVGRAVESVTPSSRGEDRATRGIPDLLFGLYAWAIVWDHHRRWWGIVSTGLPEPGSLE